MRPTSLDDLRDLCEKLRLLRIQAAQVRAQSREMREVAAATRAFWRAGAPIVEP